jgi:hypothetical protein
MQPFHVLTLADVKIGFDDFYKKRQPALLLTKVGAGHEDILAHQRKEIDELPPALTGGRPLAEDLAETDEEHDGFGLALWHVTEAYLKVPKDLDAQIFGYFDLLEEQREAANRAAKEAAAKEAAAKEAAAKEAAAKEAAAKEAAGKEGAAKDAATKDGAEKPAGDASEKPATEKLPADLPKVIGGTKPN